MSDSVSVSGEEPTVALSYFNKQGKKQQEKANAQIRKGYYNGEQYHRLQETTHVLIIVYYITITVFALWFIIRGAYSDMSKILIAVNSFVLITIPYILYYYFVDGILFVFNHIMTFITSMSIRNLIAIVTTVILGIAMIAMIFTAPVMALMTPIVISLSAIIITLGFVLKGTFMA